MNIVIIGASGFIGTNLTKYLLENTDHKIFAISRNVENIIIEDKYKDRIKKIKADVLNFEEMKNALNNIDVAFYLVHSMADNDENFYEKESHSAEVVGKALEYSKVKRVIYLSGLGDDNCKNLSKHLQSRHKTGEILRKYNNEVIELRASMIIGEGSISFEIIKDIVEKSYIIILPKWANTKTEPIGLSDILIYLENSIDIKIDNSKIVEIGGGEVISYLEFIKKYAKWKNKKVLVFRSSVLSEKTAGLFLKIFTSKKQSKVGQCMLSSFRNEMIVTNNNAKELFPNIYPQKIEGFLFKR